MILAPDAIESWAQKLDEAEQTRQTIPLLSASAEGLTVADSYAVQRAWVDRKVARGRRHWPQNWPYLPRYAIGLGH